MRDPSYYGYETAPKTHTTRQRVKPPFAVKVKRGAIHRPVVITKLPGGCLLYRPTLPWARMRATKPKAAREELKYGKGPQLDVAMVTGSLWPPQSAPKA